MGYMVPRNKGLFDGKMCKVEECLMEARTLLCQLNKPYLCSYDISRTQILKDLSEALFVEKGSLNCAALCRWCFEGRS